MSFGPGVTCFLFAVVLMAIVATSSFKGKPDKQDGEQ